MRSLALEFAPRGYACGALVVRGPGLALRIHVVPKVWGLRQDSQLELSGQEQVVEVTEMSRLTIDGTSEALRSLRTALDDERRRWDADEHPLFSFGAPAGGGPPSGPGPRTSSMWKLVVDLSPAKVVVSASQRALTKTDVGAMLALETGIRIPELKRLHAGLLLRELDAAVARRLPIFRRVQEELPTVRGQVSMVGLLRRRVNPERALLCEFDELDLDDAWSRVVRAAVRMIARDQQLPVELRSHALAIDGRLHGVSVLQPRTALRGLPRTRLPRKLRVLHRVFPLSRSLLRNQYMYGSESHSPKAAAVAASLVIDTSDVYEEVLKAGFSAVAGYSADVGGAVKLLRAPGNWKFPDISISGANGTRILMDAKYKSLDRRQGMPMGDQYQRFAYAVAGRAPTLFSYADGDAAWVFDRTNSEPGWTVGQGVIPMPNPGSVATGNWIDLTAERAQGVLQALAVFEDSEQGQRPQA